MWGTGNYPITIVETLNYTKDADEFFEDNEHSVLKSLLAWNPENGMVLEGTGGVRVMQWPSRKTGKLVSVVYYFRDLNMPLYILALYRRALPLSPRWRAEMKELVDELVAQHREEWRLILIRQRTGGQEPA
jgi:hypothetical protein